MKWILQVETRYASRSVPVCVHAGQRRLSALPRPKDGHHRMHVKLEGREYSTRDVEISQRFWPMWHNVALSGTMCRILSHSVAFSPDRVFKC